MDFALATVFAFGCAIFFWRLAALTSPQTERTPFRRLLRLVGNGVVDAGALDVEVARSARAPSPLLQALEQLANRLSPATARRRLAARLEAAGVGDRITPATLLGLRLAGAAGGLLVASFAYAIADPHAAWRPLAAFLVAFALGAAPDIWLRDATAARQKKLRTSMPDVLDLLVVSVEVGLGFDAAVQRVVQKLQGPLVDELRRMLRDTQLGQTRGQSLRSMAQRCQVRELTVFVGGICQAEQLGGSIAQALRVQSRAMRVKQNQRLREQAAKLPIKMLFPLVFFIFPAIFIILLGPGIIKLAGAFGG